jgi:hypothetical protein
MSFKKRFRQGMKQAATPLPPPIIPQRQWRTEPAQFEEEGPFRQRKPTVSNITHDVNRSIRDLERGDIRPIKYRVDEYIGHGGYNINEPVPIVPLAPDVRGLPIGGYVPPNAFRRRFAKGKK